MQMWMNDPTNVDKLNSLKPETRRPAGDGKRRFNGDSSSDRSSPLDTLDDGSNDGSAKKARGPVSDEQREALNIAFALADDEGLPLLDFDDLRALLIHVGEHADELSLRYGNVASARWSVQHAKVSAKGGRQTLTQYLLNM